MGAGLPGTDGRPIRLVNIIDEHTREALVMHAARSIDADEVVARLDALVARRGRAPRFVRMDNGPELTSHALRDWCRFSAAGSVFIGPGCPWQNPFVESFHSRVRFRTRMAATARGIRGCALIALRNRPDGQPVERSQRCASRYQRAAPAWRCSGYVAIAARMLSRAASGWARWISGQRNRSRVRR